MLQLIKYNPYDDYIYYVYKIGLDGGLIPVCDIHGKPKKFYRFSDAVDCIQQCKDSDNISDIRRDYFVAIKEVEEDD